MGIEKHENERNDKSSTPKKTVVSSKKKDPKEILEYWTPEKMESAKPVPLPERKKPPKSISADE